MEKTVKRILSWGSDETGFQVFESSVLALGGVSIALFVAVVVLTIASSQYITIGSTTVGNGVEVNAALQQFH